MNKDICRWYISSSNLERNDFLGRMQPRLIQRSRLYPCVVLPYNTAGWNRLRYLRRNKQSQQLLHLFICLWRLSHLFFLFYKWKLLINNFHESKLRIKWRFISQLWIICCLLFGRKTDLMFQIIYWYVNEVH